MGRCPFAWAELPQGLSGWILPVAFATRTMTFCDCDLPYYVRDRSVTFEVAINNGTLHERLQFLHADCIYRTLFEVSSPRRGFQRRFPRNQLVTRCFRRSNWQWRCVILLHWLGKLWFQSYRDSVMETHAQRQAQALHGAWLLPWKDADFSLQDIV